VTDYPDEELPILRMLPLTQRLFSLADLKKHYGLTKSQIVIMIALLYRESVTMSMIAEYMSSSKEQATRVVAGLVDNGLVERFEHSENRTRVYVRLTEAGKSYMKKCRTELYAQLHEKVDVVLSAEEKEQLHLALNTAVALLSKVQDASIHKHK